MLTMAEFIESYGKTGAAKAKASAGRLLLLGMLAGFFIAAAAAATSTAAHTAPNAGAAKLICGLLFPFGLIMVVLTGAELFTGNCLISISVLRGDTGFGGMGRNLALVYRPTLPGPSSVLPPVPFPARWTFPAGRWRYIPFRLRPPNAP